LNSDGTYVGIYKSFQAVTNISDAFLQEIMAFEIETEMNYSYLIEQNYKKVRDGDILITDMYHSYDTIVKLLHSCGFNKNTNIFVSYNGKKDRWIWDRLKLLYHIQLHIGDNPISDALNANLHGIPSIRTTQHLFTHSEQLLMTHAGKSGTKLALLLRRFRHRNHYEERSLASSLFLEQAEYNIPTLLLLAYQVKDIMDRERLSRVLFTTRDGCLLKRVFQFLYPSIPSHELHASRFAYLFPSKAYKQVLVI
jgi:predicted HAD superfamily hydrolase